MTISSKFPYANLRHANQNRVSINKLVARRHIIGKHFKLNERIRARTVRLIDENEKQVGIVAIEKALEMARANELDLVEVAPNVNPPVCKILDFGKFLYHQKKLEQKQTRQKQTEVKGVRLSMRTDTHDLETKAKQAKGFLEERNLVKVALVLRGREFTHVDLALDKMKKFAEMLKEISTVEQQPKRTGNTLIMMLVPK